MIETASFKQVGRISLINRHEDGQQTDTKFKYPQIRWKSILNHQEQKTLCSSEMTHHIRNPFAFGDQMKHEV